MINREEFEKQREAENKEFIAQAREALTLLPPGSRISVVSQEAAARISQVSQVLPEFPSVMLAITESGRKVFMCNHGKGSYILFRKTKLSATGRPMIQWVKSQLKRVDILLYGFPESTVYENYLETPLEREIYRM